MGVVVDALAVAWSRIERIQGMMAVNCWGSQINAESIFGLSVWDRVISLSVVQSCLDERSSFQISQDRSGCEFPRGLGCSVPGECGSFKINLVTVNQ